MRAQRYALAVAALFTAACGGSDRPATPASVGQPAPTYEALQMDGTPVALADLRGDVVLLNIWATWCKPCREEIPALDSLHQEFADRGLRVVGVSIDVITDTARIAGFARELGASYALWRDPDDRVSATFRAIGVPSTYLVDRDGTLRWIRLGAVHAGDARLRALLDSTLTAAPSAASTTDD